MVVVNIIRDTHRFARLDEIQPAWVKEAFAALIRGDVHTQYRTPYRATSIAVMASAMRDLESAMRKAYGYRGQFISCFKNADLGLPRRRLDNRRGADKKTGERAFTSGQADEFLAWMRVQAGRRRGKAAEALRAFEVIAAAGLRQEKELLHAQYRTVAGHIEVKGKGGRWRSVEEVDPAILTGGFSVSARTLQRWVQRWVRETGVREESPGVHALRGAFLQKTYKEELRRGKTDKEARRIVSRRAGHNRTSASYPYLRGRRSQSTERKNK